MGGSSEREGRVEVCLGGLWGTVCDSSWGVSDANVVCQQLGYGSKGEKDLINLGQFFYYNKPAGACRSLNAHFGQGSGPLHIGDVECIGTEKDLLSCTHVTQPNCRHSDDAGVWCPGKQQQELQCMYIVCD